MAADAANIAPLRSVMSALGAPAQTPLSRPIIGNRANATTPGRNGGWLFGSGAGGLGGGTGGTAGNGGPP